MSRILIRGGRVVDPEQDLDDVRDILIEDGRIVELAPRLTAEAQTVIDATGWILAPGFIDIHVHLREPGYEEKETIATGSRAAAAGGFTAVACMANTNPANDCAAVTRWIRDKARTDAVVRVWPIAAVTRHRAGEELTEMAEIREEGAVAFSDDGLPIARSEVMRTALEYSRMLDCPIVDHCEDRTLTRHGVMNEGVISARLGLIGMPAQAETIMVARDILLAELTGAHVHIAHVSTRQSVELIRWARKKGIRVTAEVTPHHLSLTEEAILESDYDTRFKVNPPLRTREDVAALIEAVQDGTIDCIASDHAPHHLDDKRVEFDLAAFGMLGLETAVAVAIQALVQPGHIDWRRLIELFTTGPAAVLHRPIPHLKPGAEAHLTAIDPNRAWTYRVETSYSRSRNSPFDGWTFQGAPVLTMVGGRIVYQRNEETSS